MLDRNIPMLFTHWERRYPYLRPAIPLAEEGLLVPFYVNGKAVGTIWAIAHNDRRKFDAEDLRLLESLGRFASAAYQTVASIDDLKLQIAAREKAETKLHELTDSLEAQVRARTQELENRNRQLADASRVTSLGVLTASIAHEVNQPLAAIVTNGETSLRWLVSDEPDIEKVRELTTRTVAGARRASEIIERMRGIASQRTPEQKLLSIGDIVNKSLDFLRHELQLKGIVLSLDLTRELPKIVGDRIQLQQVLVNLTINAVQAMTQRASTDRNISVRIISQSPTRCIAALRTAARVLTRRICLVFSIASSQPKTPAWVWVWQSVGPLSKRMAAVFAPTTTLLWGERDFYY